MRFLVIKLSLIWVLQFSECSECSGFQTPWMIEWLEIEEEEVVRKWTVHLRWQWLFLKTICVMHYGILCQGGSKPDRECHCSLMMKHEQVNWTTIHTGNKDFHPLTCAPGAALLITTENVSNLVNYHSNLIIVFKYPLVSAILHLSQTNTLNLLPIGTSPAALIQEVQ